MKKLLLIVYSISLIASCTSPGKNDKIDTTPVCISDSTKQANCVNITSDEKNLPVISWCETQKVSGHKSFYMAFLNHQSGKFSDRINIPIEQNTNMHEEGMPKVAFKGDGTIVAVYETSVNSEENRFAGHVRYTVSADRGKTWSKPGFLHSDTSGDNSHSFAAITRLSDGEVGACWLDQSLDDKVNGRPVKFAKTNHDNRFQNELIIDSVACQCCRIALASGAGGKIAVAFRDIINDSIRDISISTSTDNGKTFTTAFPFSEDDWAINGCPHNGPSLAVSGANIYVTWFTGGRRKGIHYCEMNDTHTVLNSRLISNQGRFIQLCVLQEGTRVLAYNETFREGSNIYSKIVLGRILGNETFVCDISNQKTKSNYPVLQPFAGDKFLVAWYDSDRIYYAVRSAGSINSPAHAAVASNVSQENNFSGIKLAASKNVVCGMTLSMSPGDTTAYKSRIYGFCSDICKGRFLEQPEYYTAK